LGLNQRRFVSAARNFALPMNPPRFELERAVRRFFSEGIQGAQVLHGGKGRREKYAGGRSFAPKGETAQEAAWRQKGRRAGFAFGD